MKKEHFFELKQNENAWLEVMKKITYREFRADGLDLRGAMKLRKKSSWEKLEEDRNRADPDIWDVMTSPKLQTINRPQFI